MTDETMRMVIVAMIASIPPTLTAIAALVVAFKGNAKIAGLHLQINSRMDQLLAVAIKAARAEGVESERALVEAARGVLKE